jgi:hypothetical protein
MTVSYKVINTGRERTPVTFARVDAIVASNFLRDRKEAGLPVPTKDQVKRATQLIERNPTLRGRFNSPLGIQQLALEIPLNRRERRINRKELGIALEPRRVRTGQEDEIRAPRANVEAWLEARPGMTAQEAGLAIAAMAGYTGPALMGVVKRVERYADSPRSRLCGHLRDKARMLDAIALSKALIDERDAKAAEAATEAQEA